MKSSEGIEKYNICFVYNEEGSKIEMKIPSAITSIELVEEFAKFMAMIGYQDESINRAFKQMVQQPDNEDIQKQIQSGKVTKLR